MDYFSQLIFSDSLQMTRIKAIIDRVAKTDITVLINGESGTGKESIARTIHEISPRASGNFLKLNCAVIPKNLLESELFGYEKGAFTGAYLQKPGKFELANGGTILLNDIGEIDVSLQGKLLQVLQEGKFFRLGGDGEVIIDARVIVTTKNHLKQAMIEGRFREDLFYRINVISIHVPPLRERSEQVLPLTEYFFNLYREKYQRDAPPLSPETIRIFKEYSWPGNIRELENIVKRIIITGEEERVVKQLVEEQDDVETMGEAGMVGNAIAPSILNLKEVGRRAGEEAERELLHAALHETHWNRKETARLLDISYKALLYKIEKYRLNHMKHVGNREGVGPSIPSPEKRELGR